MWIDRKIYQEHRDQLVQAQATASAEVAANRALKESLNWLMLRVTQLERERAVFIERMFGVKINVPEIAPAAIVPDPFAEHPLNTMPSWDDMGDEEALRQGVSHTPEGTVQYTK